MLAHWKYGYVGIVPMHVPLPEMGPESQVKTALAMPGSKRRIMLAKMNAAMPRFGSLSIITPSYAQPIAKNLSFNRRPGGV
jgi:hypothetical protein